MFVILILWISQIIGDSWNLAWINIYCCYDHQTFTAIAVFYNVLGGLSGRCFLITALHFGSVIWSPCERERERTARSVGGDAARPPPHVRFPTHKSLGTVLSEIVAMLSLSAPSTVACNEQLVHSMTTNRDIHLFPITTLALAPTDIWHRHRHCGGMSYKTLPQTEL